MNEIKEILASLFEDGITDERLEEIRKTHSILGKLLDSAQSANGISAEVSELASKHLLSSGALN